MSTRSSENRTSSFQRNQLLEKLLIDLNGDLQPSEERLIEKYLATQQLPYPLILIMGPLRSGTTLFTQWLANTGLVSYPTNLLSRFYQAPIVGAKIQMLLTDPRYNFRDELGELLLQIEYKSENGKTKGVLAPNEFWYFWRRFFAEPARDIWTDDELRQSMDTRTMRAELAGIMDVFQKPFAAKGMLFNYNIPFLDSVIENLLIVQIKREPVANVASVLEARKRQLGRDTEWYSFKIPEYEKLKGLDPVDQAAGQVHYINKAVSAGLVNVADHRKLIVEYEAFCKNPANIYEKFCRKIKCHDKPYEGPESFNITPDPTPAVCAGISSSLAQFKGS